MKKQQIIDILIKHQETLHGVGSCGELGDVVQAIDADDFSDIADEIIELDCNTDEFDKAVEPAIRYMFKHQFPHAKIYIDYNTAELLISEKCHNLNNEIPD
jgi:uncharacterized FAD-dependent dehydrogenase